MKFAEYLRKNRKEKGIPQRELAEKVGVNYTYISKMENGTLPPPAEDTLLRIIDVLDLDTDEAMSIAKKVSTELKDYITEYPEMMEIIRIIKESNISLSEIELMLKSRIEIA